LFVLKGLATASPLCNFMMSSPDIVMGLIVTLSTALCETCDFQVFGNFFFFFFSFFFLSSQTLSHTMEILERLIGVLLSKTALHGALGGPLLRALLKVQNKEQTKETKFVFYSNFLQKKKTKAVSKRANNENVGRFLRVAAEIYVRLRGASPLPLNVLKVLQLCVIVEFVVFVGDFTR
jgi:hypothetical protein